MTNCDVFVFGRTSTIDYRWLMRPKAPLSESFFSKVLEFSPRELGARKKLFISERNGGFCVFATFFLHSTARDERGRPIAFAVGLTCPDSAVREFNYRLPTLISEMGWLEQTMSEELLTAVRADKLIANRIVDITRLTPRSDQQSNGSSALLKSVEVGGVSQSRNLPSAYGQSTPLTKLPTADSTIFSDVEIVKISDELRASADTPKRMANFDAAACGSMLDNPYIGNMSHPTGQSKERDHSPSRIATPNLSLLEQADALLGGTDAKAAIFDSRIPSQGAQGEGLSSKKDVANSNLDANAGAEDERPPGFFDTLGAMFGALSVTGKGGRKPD